MRKSISIILEQYLNETKFHYTILYFDFGNEL